MATENPFDATYVPLPKTTVNTAEIVRIRELLQDASRLNELLESLEKDLNGHETDEERQENTLASLCNACKQMSNTAEEMIEQLVSTLRSFLIQSPVHLDRQAEILNAIRNIPESKLLPGTKKWIQTENLLERMRKMADSGGLDIHHESRSKLLARDNTKRIGTIRALLTDRSDEVENEKPKEVPVMNVSEENEYKLMGIGIPTSSTMMAYQLFGDNAKFDTAVFQTYLSGVRENTDLTRTFFWLCAKSLEAIRESKKLSSSEVKDLGDAMLSQLDEKTEMPRMRKVLSSLIPEMEVETKEIKERAPKKMPEKIQPPSSPPEAKVATIEGSVPDTLEERLMLTIKRTEEQRIVGNLQRLQMYARLLLCGDAKAETDVVKKAFKKHAAAYHADRHKNSEKHRAVYEFLMAAMKLIKEGKGVSDFRQRWLEASSAVRIIDAKKKEGPMPMDREALEQLLENLDAAKEAPSDKKLDIIIETLQEVIRLMSER